MQLTAPCGSSPLTMATTVGWTTCRSCQRSYQKYESLSEHDLLSIGRYLLDVSFVTSLTSNYGRPQWPRGLRLGSAAACLLGLLVRIPPEAWMSVSHEWCVLFGRVLIDGPTPRPVYSDRVWCVWMWSWILVIEEALVHSRLLHHGKKKVKLCTTLTTVYVA